MCEGEEGTFGELCASLCKVLVQFCREYPELDLALGTALSAARLLVQSCAARPDLTRVETHRVMMWQTVHGYQQYSLPLIISRNTDAGLALLRLASELARDVHVIADDAYRLDVWLHRRKGIKRDQYKRMFQFDLTNPAGRMAHECYKVCSQFGVHGHLTDSMYLEPERRWLVNGTELVMLRASDTGVLSALDLWLRAYRPLNDLCFQRFNETRQHQFAEVYELFAHTAESLTPVSVGIAERLRERRTES